MINGGEGRIWLLPLKAAAARAGSIPAAAAMQQ